MTRTSLPPIRSCSWHTARFAVRASCIVLATLVVACGADHPRVPRDKAPAWEALSRARDPRVDSLAYLACGVADSLLRLAPGVGPRWAAALPFDSIWPGSTARWGCRVLAAGHSRVTWLSVDSAMQQFRSRGWSDRTMISADGPDGTVQGVHRHGVTCVVEGRWDGGDDSDTTYVPSDTIEVRISCARTVANDTLNELSTPPAAASSQSTSGVILRGRAPTP